MDELKFVLILSFWFSLGVGKSSLIKRYICDMNPTEIAPTIGASFSTFKIKLEEGKVKMQVILRKTMRHHCVYYLYNLILFHFISLFGPQIWDTGRYFMTGFKFRFLYHIMFWILSKYKRMMSYFNSIIRLSFHVILNVDFTFIWNSWTRKVSCNDADVLSKRKCRVTGFWSN